GKRPPVVVLDVAGGDSLGGLCLGLAISDCAVPVGALLRRAQTPASKADRSRLAGHSIDQPMAAASESDLSWRRQLRRARSALPYQQYAGHRFDYATASGRATLRSRAQTQGGADWTSASQRGSPPFSPTSSQ